MLKQLKTLAVLLVVAANGVTMAQAEPTTASKAFWDITRGAWSEAEWAAYFDERFGYLLRALNEQPVLSNPSVDGEAISVRLLLLPSFQRRSMIRVDVDDEGKMRYVLKHLKPPNGSARPDLILSTTGRLHPTQVRAISELLILIDPFGDSTPPEVFSGGGCADGTHTVLEFAGEGQHKIVSRHECELSVYDPLRDLIVLLDEVSGGRLIVPGTF